MKAAPLTASPLPPDPYGDVALGVECAWPVPQLGAELSDGSPEFSFGSATTSQRNVRQTSPSSLGRSLTWRSRLSLVLAAALLLVSGATRAQTEEPAYAMLGAGATGIFHHNSHLDHTVAIVSAEHRARRDL